MPETAACNALAPVHQMDPLLGPLEPSSRGQKLVTAGASSSWKTDRPLVQVVQTGLEHLIASSVDRMHYVVHLVILEHTLVGCSGSPGLHCSSCSADFVALENPGHAGFDEIAQGFLVGLLTADLVGLVKDDQR